jgi:hypothetical protein
MERIVRTVVRSSRGGKAAVARARRVSITREPEAHRKVAPPGRTTEKPLRVRPVMPPHSSPNLTYEQALEGWRRLEQEKQARRQRLRHGREPSVGEASP